MTLLLIPVLLLGGIVMIQLGVNGVPALQLNRGALGLMNGRFSMKLRQESPQPAREPTSFAKGITRSDVLLADVLTELLEVRSELAELREQMAELAQKPDAAAAAPRARTRRVRGEEHPRLRIARG